jgi:PilZ domain-containing protein
MTRYDFGAIAEVIDLDSREDMIGVTRDLSLSGCFIRAKAPFQKGTAVIVRIRCSGTDFAATGRVTANVNTEGMGIEFVEIQPKDQATIEQWLDPRPPACRDTRSLPVTVFGQLSSGDFSEETETRITTYDTASLRLAAAVSPGQVVRLRNRLTHDEQKCRVVSVAPESNGPKAPEAPEVHTVKLLTIEFLGSVRNFWNFRDEDRPDQRGEALH